MVSGAPSDFRIGVHVDRRVRTKAKVDLTECVLQQLHTADRAEPEAIESGVLERQFKRSLRV